MSLMYPMGGEGHTPVTRSGSTLLKISVFMVPSWRRDGVYHEIAPFGAWGPTTTYGVSRDAHAQLLRIPNPSAPPRRGPLPARPARRRPERRAEPPRLAGIPAAPERGGAGARLLLPAHLGRRARLRQARRAGASARQRGLRRRVRRGLLPLRPSRGQAVHRAARGPVPQRLRREAGGDEPHPAHHAPAPQ